ncbi:HesA/MoeB/ThiF family protein [Amaricoccus solimangrovi]|uniref:HesA/MoeB/ThiF family protein n=1 Tax=Amaricoccus solimangrovi TaxID=2589815 RepID=UPI0015E3562B|nr:HesA/MoeB/ThiF family protein [Amaricoccus solimangrovi]
MNRYARQMILPEVGPEGQARLAEARVLVVGAGGLGVPALQYLAGAGVGRITVVDPDVVERGNLHRQVMYGDVWLGRFKAEAAAGILRGLNPEVAVRPLVAALDPANAGGLVERADLVLDCADSFAVSYTLSDACLAAGRPLVSASALGLGGYAGGFCGGAPSLRAVFPDLPERAASCATAGILGPVVGLLGCLQARMALGVLLGLEPSPLGQLVTFDEAMRFGGFRFDRAEEPADPLRFAAPEEIDAEDFVADLRGADEAPVAVGARHPVDAFGPGGPRPAPGQRAVLVCRSGLRAWRAARRLRADWGGEIRLVAMGDRQGRE